MSSQAPYKSRLFNFINRNYIKLNSKVNIKIRELGYVVQGSLQTLVLPLFWLWETTKKISKSFVSSSESQVFLSTEETENLRDNSDLVLTINHAINNDPDLPFLPSQNFQGLACRLKDKRLIVILKKNKVKNIIPFKQQAKVNLLIDKGVDDFESRQLLPSNTNFLSGFLTGLNIFGKSKAITKVIQKFNHLQPSDLVPNSQVNNNSIIAFIDNLLVSLERFIFPNSNSIEPQNQDSIEQNREVSEEDKITILRLIRQALEYFFLGKNIPLSENNNIKENALISNDNNSNLPSAQKGIQGIITKSQETVENIIPQIQESTEKLITESLNQLNTVKNKLNNPDDPFQIQVIIWVAIKYFFTQKKFALSTNSKKNFLPSFSETEVILINNEIADPWLSWEDLYHSPSPLSDSIDNNDNNESSLILPYENNSFNNIVKNQENLNTISTANNAVLDIPKTEKQEIIAKKNINNLSETQVTLEEEIEVKVIEIKYEKHFLEIILEKLDQVILWLEEILIKIVKKIKMLRQK
ncbi:hypothetical protein ACN4EE_14175 [Geminocystis sp. CENA526]|uniref:hypothetical protein n=1 Tax=Geminocystis sp. CENA526 TaxID=1355871 RepID=UPI003D6F1566